MPAEPTARDAASAVAAVLAASRDASVWDRPNTRDRKRLHVAVNVVDLGSIGGQEWHGEAACDPRRVVLDMSVAGPAAEVRPDRRCQRRGCAVRWPSADEIDGGTDGQ